MVTFSVLVPTTTYSSISYICYIYCAKSSPHLSRWLKKDKQNEVVVLLCALYINCAQFCEH